MRDQECIEFLQWCLPQLDLRWAGFRKVRHTVCKRVTRRMRELGCANTDAYMAYIATHQTEWKKLDAFCRIPISRFYRDHKVFEHLAQDILPSLARSAARAGRNYVRCWSAGCASGEEPYSLRIAWAMSAPRPPLDINVVATDADRALLERAERGCYSRGSLKELPPNWHECGLKRSGDLFCVKTEIRQGINFEQQDIRHDCPEGLFDLILCRYVAFTYFAPAVQARVFSEIDYHLRPGGFLILGSHENLPDGAQHYQQLEPGVPIYSKRRQTD